MRRFRKRRRKTTKAATGNLRYLETGRYNARVDELVEDADDELYTGRNDVTKFTAMIRSPFCGYNVA